MVNTDPKCPKCGMWLSISYSNVTGQHECYSGDGCMEPAKFMTQPETVTLPRAEAAEKERDEAWNAGRDAAAEVLRKAWVNYDAEFGNTDYETGTREYPGNGDEMMNEWEELEEEIRALKRPQEPS